MQMKIKKIILDQFKGVRHAEYDLSDRTTISGMNGSGKTTIATAHFWLWADKDYELASNPEVTPLFMEESEPTVIEIIEINGIETTVVKRQKDARTKKQREAGDPYRPKNEYEINSVPKTQKDFIRDMEERGISMVDFLLLSHPEIFTSQKTADCRKLLFNMASAVSDEDIAKEMEDAEQLAALFSTYKLEEVEAMTKASKKKASERLDAIPNQIIGLESAIVDVEAKELKARRQRLAATAEAEEKELNDTPEVSKSAVNTRIMEIELQQGVLVNATNDKRTANIRTLQNHLDGLKRDYQNVVFKVSQTEDELSHEDNIKRDRAFELSEKREDLSKAEATTFPEDKAICPTCGREFPEDRVESIKENWKETHDAYVATLRTNCSKLEENVQLRQELIAKLSKSLEELRANEKKLEKEVDTAQKALEDAQSVPEITGGDIPEYITLEAEKKKLQDQLSEIDELDRMRIQKRTRIQSIKDEISEIDRELAKDSVNEHSREEIARLKGEQREKGQELSNAERILDQISRLNMEKNKRLEESVNSRFPEFVKFQLFRTQKNGETKDCCIPLIKDKDGWKDFNTSANTGLKILGKLGIINGVQKFFEQSLPVFLDNAESLDSKTKERINMDSQIIFLEVTDSALQIS